MHWWDPFSAVKCSLHNFLASASRKRHLAVNVRCLDAGSSGGSGAALAALLSCVATCEDTGKVHASLRDWGRDSNI